MATYYARASGNVNGSIWATTPSGTAAAQTFAAGDVLVANSFTVTVNVSTDLGSTGEVRNDAFSGATTGGSFSLSNGVTLTANVFAGSATCVTLAGTASAAVVGNVTGGTSASAFGVSNASSGTLTVTGAVTGGTISTAHGAYGSAGTIVITGNCTGATANAVNLAFTATATIVGNVTGGANRALFLNGGTSATVTGTVTGSSVNSGGDGVGGAGGPFTLTGTAIGGNLAVAVTSNGAGTWAITRAKGGALAGSLVGVAAGSGSVTTVEEIEFGDLGASPTSGPIRLTDKASNVAVMYRFGTTKKNLVDANASGLMPAASNVRSGTVYNGGNSTGTCAVPAASSVAFGVPVDATTGTAALTPAAVWNYATSAATTSGSMGERLKDAATVASVGQALADALTP